MKYRKLGKTGLEVSALGFGCMRYPAYPDKSIDVEQTTAMVRHAIDHGVNYFDTAFGYFGGKSEEILGGALKDGYRAKVAIATKYPVGRIKSGEPFEVTLNTQLTRLGTDCIDLYLFHGMSADKIAIIQEYKLLDAMEAAVSKGQVKHIAFSFHDDFEGFKKVVDLYDNWAMAQIQYNYMDRNNQAGERGLYYAAERGLGIVCMEPLLGGRLAFPAPKAAEAFAGSDKVRHPVQWALDWLWRYPEVTVALSGMSSMQNVSDNIAYANAWDGAMTPADLLRVEQAEIILRELTPIPCTGCEYCAPCPHEVDIYASLLAMNEGHLYGKDFALRTWEWVKKGHLPTQCTKCGACLPKCPQGINIMEELPKVMAYMESIQ
jgi:hypothetical protein